MPALTHCRFKGDWHHIAWLHTGGAAQSTFERKIGQQCTTAEFSSPKHWGWSADRKFSVRYSTRQLAKRACWLKLVVQNGVIKRPSLRVRWRHESMVVLRPDRPLIGSWIP